MSAKLLALAFLLFGNVYLQTATSQRLNNSNGITQKNLETKDIKFNVSFQNEKIKQGEKVELKISIKNNYSQNIYRSYNSNDIFQGFRIEIRNAKGEIVIPTKNLMPDNGRFSLWGFEYGPGQENKQSLVLSDYYDLPIGKYSVVVITDIYAIQRPRKKQAVSIKSKTAFIVMGNGNASIRRHQHNLRLQKLLSRQFHH